MMDDKKTFFIRRCLLEQLDLFMSLGPEFVCDITKTKRCTAL